MRWATCAVALLWGGPGGSALAAQPEVRAVVFDLGGVVVSSVPAVSELRWFASSFGLSWWNVARHARGPLQRAVVGEDDFEVLVRKFVWSRGGHVTPGWPMRFREHYAQATHVHEDVLTLVRCLQQHGLRTALLSNTISPHAEVDAARGAYADFAPVVLSFAMHAAKPDAAAYRAAVDALALAPEACVMVDDRQENVAGARAFGMRGVRYTSLAQLRRELRALGVAPACTEGSDPGVVRRPTAPDAALPHSNALRQKAPWPALRRVFAGSIER